MSRFSDINQRKSPKSIYLPEEIWDFLTERGEGKPSKGIRSLVKDYRELIKETPLPETFIDDKKI